MDDSSQVRQRRRRRRGATWEGLQAWFWGTASAGRRCLHFDMSEQRRTDRKRTQTQDQGPGPGRPGELTKPPLPARMTTWVGLCSSARWGGGRGARLGWPARLAPRSPSFAPPPAQRQRALHLVQAQWPAPPPLAYLSQPLASSWRHRQRAPRPGCRLVPRATASSWAWGRALSRWSLQMTQMPQLHTTKTGVRPAAASTRAVSGCSSASQTQQPGPWSTAAGSPAASSLSSSAGGRAWLERRLPTQHEESLSHERLLTGCAVCGSWSQDAERLTGSELELAEAGLVGRQHSE